jgi:hypothetical protein
LALHGRVGQAAAWWVARSELPRITIPRTSVNKGLKEGGPEPIE